MVIDSKSHTNGGGQVSVIVFKWERLRYLIYLLIPTVM